MYFLSQKEGHIKNVLQGRQFRNFNKNVRYFKVLTFAVFEQGLRTVIF
jgi:hypothetical protein